MYMTEGEICAMYRQAASPKDEITVLAQLNAVPTETIEAILQKNGYPVKVRKRLTVKSTGRHIITPEDERFIEEKSREGWTNIHIAHSVGCGVSTVSHVLLRLQMRATKNRKESRGNERR